MPARSHLLETTKEGAAYGLYSYLLLPAQPLETATRERYLSAIEAFLTIPEVSTAEKYLKPSELNITYVFLRVAPPPDIAQCLESQCAAPDFPKAVSWMVENYDYARAQVLLRAFSNYDDTRGGPYLVSQLKPLTGSGSLDERHLFQDQSTVPPDLIRLWTQEFLLQAGKERFWEASAFRSLALNLRTAIAQLAIGIPAVKLEVTKLIEYTGI